MRKSLFEKNRIFKLHHFESGEVQTQCVIRNWVFLLVSWNSSGRPKTLERWKGRRAWNSGANLHLCKSCSFDYNFSTWIQAWCFMIISHQFWCIPAVFWMKNPDFRGSNCLLQKKIDTIDSCRRFVCSRARWGGLGRPQRSLSLITRYTILKMFKKKTFRNL